MLRLVMCLALASTPEPDAATLARHAETAWRAGRASAATPLQARQHFARAAEAYLALHQHGLRTPALYRNLGKAAFQAGQPERALWAFHHAHWLDPDDSTTRALIEQVRAQVAYPTEGLCRPAGNRGPTPRLLMLALGVGNGLACLGWAGGRWRRSRYPLALTLPGVAAIAVALAGLGFLHHQARDAEKHPTVIVARERVPFLLGNGPSYPAHADVPALPRGQEARQLLRRGGWLQVELPGGPIGWLPADRVLVVE